MKKSIIAAALSLGVAAAAPPLYSAHAQTQGQNTSGVSAPAAGPAASGGPMAAGMPGHPGMQEMWRGGWQRHAMMMRGAMMHHWTAMQPRQRCEEKIARRAGIVAYTITKLNLTAQQKPLWNRVQTALQTAGDRARQLCATLPSREAMRQQTVLDRLNRREQALSAHLQALQQVKPAMQQFYQSLTADQQAILNHPFRPG
jgi:hypothetical protein